MKVRIFNPSVTHQLAMTIKLSVPTIVCQGCVDTVTNAVKTLDDQATVQVDLATKVVEIETQQEESLLRQAIVATGHTVL